MDVNHRNMGTYDTMHSIAENKAQLARDQRNDAEGELTTKHYNSIFHKLKTKLKGLFKKR